MKCENCGADRLIALYPNKLCKTCHETMPKYKVMALIRKQNAEKKELNEKQ